jgi:hypothetical protein
MMRELGRSDDYREGVAPSWKSAHRIHGQVNERS